jgi:hypothetical protein
MTHYVNQELAKHHYATLLREAQNERLVHVDDVEPPRSRVRRQLTWARRRILAARTS